MRGEAYSSIKSAQNFTENMLSSLRKDLSNALQNNSNSDEITIIVTGSYGRGEATIGSDVDYFIILERDQSPDNFKTQSEEIRQVIAKHCKRSTGDSGTFGKDAVVPFNEMLCNIGGQDDTNISLTRRLLFLLEGIWLYGEARFQKYRRQLLEEYIQPDLSEKQIPRFFLNDIIRYYRTIATDFEYKTREEKKGWGLRNIKLRFSRKLIYFSGVVVAAELYDLNHQEKIRKAEDLFDKPVLKRVESLGSNLSAKDLVFQSYEVFTRKMADPDIRNELDDIEKESRNESKVFTQLKAESDDFSQALQQWLTEKYNKNHPIHHALVF